MAEYIEREAAKKAVRNVWLGVEAINKISSADVVEVVRCKDCKHLRDYTDRHGVECWYCIKDNHIPTVEPEHFCSYGERRDSDG